MYIFVMEEGTVLKSLEVTDAELEAADDGLMEVIDTADMTTYYDGKWHDIGVVKTRKV